MISRMSCRVSLSIGEQSIFRKAIFIRLSPSKRERPAVLTLCKGMNFPEVDFSGDQSIVRARIIQFKVDVFQSVVSFYPVARARG
jgi:hypothetical protein